MKYVSYHVVLNMDNPFLCLHNLTPQDQFQLSLVMQDAMPGLVSRICPSHQHLPECFEDLRELSKDQKGLEVVIDILQSCSYCKKNKLHCDSAFIVDDWLVVLQRCIKVSN